MHEERLLRVLNSSVKDPQQRIDRHFDLVDRFLEKPRPFHIDENTVPRLRLWEIADFLVCPVVGQCLSIDEQRQVLKRTKLPAKKMTRHELHEILVSCADEETFLSAKVDNLLQGKFGKESKNRPHAVELQLEHRFRCAPRRRHCAGESELKT